MEKNFFHPSYISNQLNLISDRSDGDTLGLDSFIVEVNNLIYTQNAANEFITELTEDYGYMAWDKGLVHNDANGVNFAAIPLVKIGGNKVETILMAYHDGNEWYLKYSYLPYLTFLYENKVSTASWINFHLNTFEYFNLMIFGIDPDLTNEQVGDRSGECCNCEPAPYGGGCVRIIGDLYQSCPDYCCPPEDPEIPEDPTDPDYNGQNTQVIIVIGGGPTYTNVFTTDWTNPGTNYGGGVGGSGTSGPTNEENPLCAENFYPMTDIEEEDPIIPPNEDENNPVMGDLSATLQVLSLTTSLVSELDLSIDQFGILAANFDILPKINSFLSGNENSSSAETAVLNYLDLILNNQALLQQICTASGGNPLAILQGLAEAGMGPEDFGALSASISNILTELELNPADYFSFLLENGNVVFQIQDFIDNNTLEHEESVREGVIMYLSILDDPDLANFDADFTTIPAFVWPFVREIAVELAIELFKRNFPGVNQYDDLIDAVNALQQGDMLSLCGEIIDLVKSTAKNLNLPLKAINVVWDGVDMGVQASKSWKVISKMEQFGGDVIEKVLQVVKSKAGGILGKLKWKKGVGAQLFDIDNPQSFIDEFLTLFPDVDGPLFQNPTQPLEQTYKIGTMTIRFYPVSITTGGPTLSFIGTPNFKIRFM